MQPTGIPPAPRSKERRGCRRSSRAANRAGCPPAKHIQREHGLGPPYPKQCKRQEPNTAPPTSLLRRALCTSARPIVRAALSVRPYALRGDSALSSARLSKKTRHAEPSSQPSNPTALAVFLRAAGLVRRIKRLAGCFGGR